MLDLGRCAEAQVAALTMDVHEIPILPPSATAVGGALPSVGASGVFVGVEGSRYLVGRVWQRTSDCTDGFKWTISFVEDHERINAGDVSPFVADPSGFTGGSGFR